MANLSNQGKEVVNPSILLQGPDMPKLQSHGRETVEAADRAPEAQAERFATVRQAHESEVAEDYVELIAELIETRGEARPVDIAERLGVKPPTVTKNISRLQATGLVRRERYRAIFLTEGGQALADACRRRHRLVVAFLRSIGVDDETAERDAEGIEHHVSAATLKAFQDCIAQVPVRTRNSPYPVEGET
jgi:DtxR family manganese transport transcriptional regulator